jgi:hypothetical protein
MASNFTSVPRSRTELLETMYRSAQREPLGQVRFVPFILKQDIKTFLAKLDTGRFRCNVSTLDEFYLLRLSRVRLEFDDGEESISGNFALFPLSGAVWCFLSIERIPVVTNTAILAIQQNASSASLVYVSTREFKRLFDQLAGKDRTIFVLQHSEYNRQESNVNYLKERRAHPLVFSELALKDAVVRRIVVELRAHKNLIAQFSVTNNGLLSLRQGSIDFFYDSVVNDVANIGNNRNAIFAGRERHKSVLHPLELSFENGLLADKGANRALIDSLLSINKSATAVFHANPYIHVLYTDFRDGSSFNIFSSSDSRLTIVPSTRASVSALMKLYRGISEKFADCDVGESSQPPPVLSEFFGE